MLTRFVLAFAVSASLACAADLEGVIRDPSDAAVAGASIRIESDSYSVQAISDSEGGFRFRTLHPGRYRLIVSVRGFQVYERRLTLRERANSIAIALRLENLRQEVTVTDRPETLGVDSSLNQDTAQASSTQLAGLPALDGDYLAPLMRFLDPAAIGSAGVSITIDGHEGPTSRVPRSMIKEVRVNNNPYSAQYSAPGRGRIEVITKDPDPGYHGSITAILRDYHLNSRDAFAAERPREQWRTYQATFTGPLGRGKRDFWMISGERIEQDTVGVVYALLPSGIHRENSPAPKHRNWATARWNHRYGQDRSLWLGYEHDSALNRNQLTGGSRLPEAGVDSGHFWNEILFSDQGLVTPNLSHSLRSWIGHVGFWTSSRTPGPATVVSGAFIGGGAQQEQFTPRTYFVITDILTYVRGRHTVTFGAELQELSRYAMSTRDNFGGTTVYDSLAAYDTGRSASFSRQFGSGRGVYGIASTGIFAQDEIQVRPGLSVVAGARYYYQNHFRGDFNNLAPRASIAWSPGRSRAIVLRTGMGMFYERQLAGILVETKLYDGIRVGRIFANPLDPASYDATGVARFDSAGRIPSSVHFHSSLELRLHKSTSLTAAYVGARGFHLLRSNDDNAPFAAGRPDPRYGQVRTIASQGSMQRDALEITARGALAPRLTGTAQYTFGKLRSDTEGFQHFPATAFDWQSEWGRANADVRHRTALLLNANGGRWLQIGAGLTLSSGPPVNVTTGGDENRDGMTLDRPPGLARNTMSGPGLAQLDLRWSRRFARKDNKHQSATFSLDAFNVTNRVNYAGYVGVLRSPLFGRAVASHPARRLQAQIVVEF